MSLISNSLQQQVPRWLLVSIRLIQGPMWIGTGWYWVNAANAASEIEQQIAGVIEQGRTYAFYLPFLEHIVLPNVDFFAIMVTAGELFIGVTLTLGLTTRLGAMVGIFVAANYACLYGNPLFPLEGNWLYAGYLLPVLLGAAGRSFGVDYWLHRRWPHVPVW